MTSSSPTRRYEMKKNALFLTVVGLLAFVLSLLAIPAAVYNNPKPPAKTGIVWGD
jgi:hypothetical protein